MPWCCWRYWLAKIEQIFYCMIVVQIEFNCLSIVKPDVYYCHRFRRIGNWLTLVAYCCNFGSFFNRWSHRNSLTCERINFNFWWDVRFIVIIFQSNLCSPTKTIDKFFWCVSFLNIFQESLILWIIWFS